MKKQDIFDTTLQLIVSKGLHDVPMSEIAKESNAAIGTIYHHFRNKDELIKALYADIHEELEDIVNLEEIDIKNYQSEFATLFLKVFKYFIQNADKFEFIQQYENSPFGKDTVELHRHIEYPIQPDFFILGQKRGFIKNTSLSLITNIVYSNIANLTRLQLSKKVELNREMIELVIDGCWEMIKR